MDERVIALTDLTKQYGRFTAVDRICLTIRTVSYTHLDVYKRQCIKRVIWPKY